MSSTKTYGGSNKQGVIGGKGNTSGESGGKKGGSLVPTKETCLEIKQTKRKETYNRC
jgi:hypothetical protein